MTCLICNSLPAFKWVFVANDDRVMVYAVCETCVDHLDAIEWILGWKDARRIDRMSKHGVITRVFIIAESVREEAIVSGTLARIMLPKVWGLAASPVQKTMPSLPSTVVSHLANRPH